ncbi:hypothetical protein [Brevundimonas sp.]|uniref:hypothetical protein n=1 Tax=Brevundimonas sp. TaxID=1871086 RepID=UPI0035B34087
MPRLRDRIRIALDDLRAPDGHIDLHEVVKAVRVDLSDEDKAYFIDRGIYADAKAASTRGRAALKERAGRTQIALPFDLDHAYALDLDGRYVKNTVDMTRIEVRRAIEIRRGQIAADKARLTELENADRECAPHWDRHPDWTFGQALEAAVKALAKQSQQAA